MKGQGEDGAEDWNRTSDTSIFSAVLYQLSYLGTRPALWDRSPIIAVGSNPRQARGPGAVRFSTQPFGLALGMLPSEREAGFSWQGSEHRHERIDAGRSNQGTPS